MTAIDRYRDEIERTKANSLYEPIPFGTLLELVLWRDYADEPTGFLQYCLRNDFVFACTVVPDEEHRQALTNIAYYIYNHLPASAWGSAYDTWAGLNPAFKPFYTLS